MVLVMNGETLQSGVKQAVGNEGPNMFLRDSTNECQVLNWRLGNDRRSALELADYALHEVCWAMDSEI